MPTYIKWSAKAIQWNYWEFFNISLKLEDLQWLVNDKGYINITMSKRKEIGKYWDTHSLVLNEYKPKENNKSEEISVEDIPF